MRAAVLTAVDVPISVQSVPDPIPTPGEARVRVSHAALNRRDFWISKGKYAGLKFPIILGSDGVGVVDSVGDLSDSTWVGKRVIVNPSLGWGDRQAASNPDTFGILGLPDDGTFAEFVVVKTSQLATPPSHLSDEQAASLPLAGLTAYRALFSRANLQSGERVLVTGIGGGVATFAAQFALAASAEVWATSGSLGKLQSVPIPGLAGGVSYRDDDWDAQLKSKADGFDVIIDSTSGPDFLKLVELANPGGRIVNFGATAGDPPSFPTRRIFWKQLSILGTTMGSPSDFQAMLEFVASHRIDPVISEVFPLDQAQSALNQLANSSQIGKLVLEIGKRGTN